MDNSNEVERFKGDVTKTFWIKLLATMQVAIASTALKLPCKDMSS